MYRYSSTLSMAEMPCSWSATPGKHRPGVALHVYPSFGICLGADLAVSGGDAADVPLAVPEDGLADFFDVLGNPCIFGRILRFPQLLGQSR